jgi:hypothetical protein
MIDDLIISSYYDVMIYNETTSINSSFVYVVLSFDKSKSLIMIHVLFKSLFTIDSISSISDSISVESNI